jgi:hypothetical protein
MKTTAKVNKQFDYVTLKIKFADGSTLNLTRSRSGTKASGTAATREALDFLDALMQSKKGQTIGDTMNQLRELAEHCGTVKEFLTVAH